jgi:ABC-type sugar transport system ATPase subunit
LKEKNEPIVKLNEISKTFGGIYALNKVNFDLMNEVHSIVGHNGAGKTTLVKILMGALHQDSGEIYLNGKQVSFTSPREAQQNHIAMVWQELSNFPNLTVTENLLMQRFIYNKLGAIDWKASNKLGKQYLERINLEVEPTMIMGKLSLAQQQLVEFCKALSFDPLVLILDEPTSALSLKEQDILFEKIHLIKSQGVAIVFISHKLDEVMSISDRITVLRDGQKIFTKRVDELDKESIVENIVGKQSDKKEISYQKSPKKKSIMSSSVVLDISDLSAERRLDNVSFSLHKGEILGITGVSGSGISEIGKILFGMSSNHSGKILLEGKPYLPSSPEFSVMNGIGYVPKERKEEGIIPGMSVGDNIVLSTLKAICIGGFIIKRKKQKIVNNIMETINLRPRDPEITISSLSGGNQQKVVMARWMSNQSRILILDEPTRGVDVGSIQMIYALLRELTVQGVSIIIISSEFEEVHGIADHIIVLNKGKVVGNLDPALNPWEKTFALAIQ